MDDDRAMLEEPFGTAKAIVYTDVVDKVSRSRSKDPAMTLAKVARQAGVSTATVSMILNGQESGRFRDETRQRVLSAAKELSYPVRTPSRSKTAGRKIRQIAFIHPHAWSSTNNRSYNYYLPMLDGIQAELQKQDGQLVFGTGLENAQLAIDFLSRRDRGIDGLLVAGEFERGVMEFLIQHKTPSVLLGDWMLEYGRLSTVMGDTEHAAYIATKHLLSQGHKKIANVGTFRRELFEFRIGGYARAMLKAGHSVLPQYMVDADLPEPLEQALTKLVKQPDPPTAMIIAEIGLAARVLNHLRSIDVEVPRDLSVVGIGYDARGPLVDPPLTCADYSRFELGRIAALRLFELLDGHNPSPTITLVPTELTVRQSTAARSG